MIIGVKLLFYLRSRNGEIRLKILCVDEDSAFLDNIVKMCRELPQIDEVTGFADPGSAMKWTNNNFADIALLNINMPNINGLQLSAEIRSVYPDISVIFVSDDGRHAVEAFEQHACGYLIKPINKRRLEAEIEDAISHKAVRANKGIVVKTFGEFDVFVNGERMNFSRSKAKELLAYLVDRQGGSVKRPMLAAVLWEDELYDNKKKEYLDVLIRSLQDTLEQYKISDIIELKNVSLRICPEKIYCDLYRFLDGDTDAFSLYQGEYMKPYTWADSSDWVLSRHNQQKRSCQ